MKRSIIVLVAALALSIGIVTSASAAGHGCGSRPMYPGYVIVHPTLGT